MSDIKDCVDFEVEIEEEKKEYKGTKKMSSYEYYNDYGNCYIKTFLERNPEFDNDNFLDFLAGKNRGDRDSGELQDVAKHEVLRVAAEWEEYKWRFPNMFPRKK
jgi:hypothetical protein